MNETTNLIFASFEDEIADAIGIEPSLLLAHIIAATIIFVLIYFFVWKHIVKYLKKREDAIKDNIDSAEKLHEEANNIKSKANEKISGASTRATEIINQATFDGQNEKLEIIKKATNDAETLINNAKIMIAAEKQQQKEQQNRQSLLAAYEIATKILQREVKEDDQKKLTEEFIKDLEKENEE